jgi:Tfp pilus assembly protein PilF
MIRHDCRAVLAAMLVALAGCRHATPSAPGGLSFTSWFNSAPSPAKPIPAPEPNAKQKAEMEMELGRSLEREGKLNEALKVYEEVAKKDSRRIDAQERMAIVNDQLGNFKEADKIYATALKREPKNFDLLCDRGYSFYLQDRDAEAESMLRQALAIDPHMARAHNNLGLVLAHNGKSDEALKEFSRGGCRESDARVNLAYCLMAQRDFSSAQKQLQLAMAADPQSDSPGRGLAHLRWVASKPATDQVALASAQQAMPTQVAAAAAPPASSSPSAPMTQPAGQGLSPQERLAFAPPRPSSEIHIVDHTEPVDLSKP